MILWAYGRLVLFRYYIYCSQLYVYITYHTLLKLRNKKHPNVFIKRFITLTSTECCPFENLNMTVYDALESVKRKNANISSIEKS